MDTLRRAAHLLVVVWMVTALAGLGGTAAAQEEQAQEKGSVTFTELNDSGLSGTAELEAQGDQTAVTMRINGVVGEHPTHIHTGTCEDLDPNPKYPLNNVELGATTLIGASDSVVDVPLEELLASDHLIIIHKSLEELDTYYACGDIVAGAPADAAPDAVAAPAGQPLGNMGSGPVGGAGGTLGMAVVLGFVSIACAAGAWGLRRRALRG